MSQYISDAHPYTRGTHATQNHRIPGYTVTPHRRTGASRLPPPPRKATIRPKHQPQWDNTNHLVEEERRHAQDAAEAAHFDFDDWLRPTDEEAPF